MTQNITTATLARVRVHYNSHEQNATTPKFFYFFFKNLLTAPKNCDIMVSTLKERGSKNGKNKQPKKHYSTTAK